jgi:hypothetical protein
MASRELKANLVPYAVMVDEEDMDILVKSWAISFKEKGQLYYSVRRRLRKFELAEGKPKTVKMHNEVWTKHFGPIPQGYEVDHIDYDTCNNTKANLRLLTKKENNERTRKKTENKNGKSMAEAA